jgi:hypothetical protein
MSPAGFDPRNPEAKTYALDHADTRIDDVIITTRNCSKLDNGYQGKAA